MTPLERAVLETSSTLSSMLMTRGSEEPPTRRDTAKWPTLGSGASYRGGWVRVQKVPSSPRQGCPCHEDPVTGPQ